MDDRTQTGRRRLASIALFALLLTLPAGVVHADIVTPATDCDVTRDAQGTITSRDAGNAMGTASPLPIPADCEGSLTDGSDDEDWYRFEVTVGRTISRLEVISRAPLFATGIKILDSRGNVAINPETGAPFCTDGTPRDTCARWKSEVNDTYYLVLTQEVGSGSYTLLTDGMPAQYDCDTPGDSADNALGLASSEKPKHLFLYEDTAAPKTRVIACSGMFDANDVSDGYQFFVGKGNIVTIDLSGVDKNVVLTKWSLFDPAFGELGQAECPAEDGTASGTTWGRHVCKPIQASGTYLLILQAANGKQQGFVRYSMTIKVRQDDCADLGTITETGDAPDTAATDADRRVFAGTCIGALDGERTAPADDPATPQVENRPAVPLDVADRLAVLSDTSTLTFAISTPFGNCLTLRVTPPGATQRAATACGPLTTDAPPDAGVATLVIPGGSGQWNVDVLPAGLTPGAPADTRNGGVYHLGVEGVLGFQADCGTTGDIASLGLAVPPRFDPDTGALNTSRSVACGGDLRATNDTDTYTLPGIEQSDIVTVTVEGDGPQACLFDAAGGARGCGKSLSGRADTAATSGTWTAVVQGPAPVASAYTIAVAVLSQSDCGNLDPGAEQPRFVDAGNTPATATSLGQMTTGADDLTGGPALEGQTCSVSTTAEKSGVLRHLTEDSADWYSVELVNQYTALVATMTPEALGDPRTGTDFDLCVVPPSGAMQCSANPPSIPEVVAAMPACPLPQGPEVPSCAGAGTWKIGVIYRAGPLGAYRLAIAGRN